MCIGLHRRRCATQGVQICLFSGVAHAHQRYFWPMASTAASRWNILLCAFHCASNPENFGGCKSPTGQFSFPARRSQTFNIQCRMQAGKHQKGTRRARASHASTFKQQNGQPKRIIMVIWQKVLIFRMDPNLMSPWVAQKTDLTRACCLFG
jgi:hypothetical protein